MLRNDKNQICIYSIPIILRYQKDCNVIKLLYSQKTLPPIQVGKCFFFNSYFAVLCFVFVLILKVTISEQKCFDSTMVAEVKVDAQ